MKYLIISLVFLCGCAAENAVDEFNPFETADYSRNVSSTKENLDDANEVAETFQIEEQKVVNQSPFRRSNAYYTLQVGAYPSKKLAVESALKLNLQKSIISYEQAEVNGKIWQRVCVGKFKNKKAALQFQKGLAQQSFVRMVQEQEE